MKYITSGLTLALKSFYDNFSSLPLSTSHIPRRRGNLRGWTEEEKKSNLHFSADKFTSVPSGHLRRRRIFFDILSDSLCKVLFSIAAIFLFTSCEQVVDVELPYVEQLVVRGIIEEGEPVTDLYIAKTLPPLENYDYMNESKYYVNDAQVTLEVNGEIFNCAYMIDSKYKCTDYIPKAGDRIKLNAKWKNMEVSAETIIPDSAKVVKYEYDRYATPYDNGGENLRIYAYLKPQEGFAYAGTWKYNQDNYDYASYRYPLVRSSLTNSDGLIKVKCFDESSWIINFGEFKDWNEFLEYIEAKILIYDEAVYDYYTNFDDYSDGDFLFGSSGQNPDWNVEGDGFGIFVGKNTTLHKIDIDIE
jgi:hypothetical protein